MYVDINLLDIYLASSLSTLKICETLRKHRSSFDFFMNLPSCLALCFRQVYAGGVFAGTRPCTVNVLHRLLVLKISLHNVCTVPGYSSSSWITRAKLVGTSKKEDILLKYILKIFFVHNYSTLPSRNTMQVSTALLNKKLKILPQAELNPVPLHFSTI